MTMIIGTIASSILQSNAAMDSIATVAGTGSSASITISNIPATFQSLHVRIYGKTSFTTNSTPMNITCSTLVAGTSYLMNDLLMDYNSSTVTSTGISDARVGIAATSATAVVNYRAVTILDIYNYKSTSIGKSWRSMASANMGTTSFSRMYLRWGSNDSLAAITSLTFTAPENFTTSNIIAVYGVK